MAAVEVDGTILIDGTGPGLKFQPDLVWIKSRSQTSFHVLCDSVRGAGVILSSNRTTGDTNNSDSQNAFKSFNLDGFTVGQGSAWSVNDSSQTHVAWCWKAGGTAVSNTDGSITSSVSANAEYGFSVVTWTGTGATGSIGHGLSIKPSLVITKNRADSTSWVVDAIGVLSSGTDYLLLNSTQAANSGGTTADNSVLNILQYNDRNGSGDGMVSY